MSESAQYPPSANTLRMKYFAHCSRLKTNRKKMRQRSSDHAIFPNRPAGLMPTARTSAQTRSRARQHTEATKRAMSRRSQLECWVRVSSRTQSPATQPSASSSTPKRRQFWQTGKDWTSKAHPASPIIISLQIIHVSFGYQSLGLGPFRFSVRISRTFLMNSIVSRYLSLLTSEALWTISAKSFVMNPRSTVSITLRSSKFAKQVRSRVLSSLARWSSPRVHAKMLAMELVEVSLPFCHCRQCRVTVPWAASASTDPSGASSTEDINPSEPYP